MLFNDANLILSHDPLQTVDVSDDRTATVSINTGFDDVTNLKISITDQLGEAVDTYDIEQLVVAGCLHPG